MEITLGWDSAPVQIALIFFIALLAWAIKKVVCEINSRRKRKQADNEQPKAKATSCIAMNELATSPKVSELKEMALTLPLNEFNEEILDMLTTGQLTQLSARISKENGAIEQSYMAANPDTSKKKEVKKLVKQDPTYIANSNLLSKVKDLIRVKAAIAQKVAADATRIRVPMKHQYGAHLNPIHKRIANSGSKKVAPIIDSPLVFEDEDDHQFWVPIIDANGGWVVMNKMHGENQEIIAQINDFEKGDITMSYNGHKPVSDMDKMKSFYEDELDENGNVTKQGMLSKLKERIKNIPFFRNNPIVRFGVEACGTKFHGDPHHLKVPCEIFLWGIYDAHGNSLVPFLRTSEKIKGSTFVDIAKGLGLRHPSFFQLNPSTHEWRLYDTSKMAKKIGPDGYPCSRELNMPDEGFKLELTSQEILENYYTLNMPKTFVSDEEGFFEGIVTNPNWKITHPAKWRKDTYVDSVVKPIFDEAIKKQTAYFLDSPSKKVIELAETSDIEVALKYIENLEEDVKRLLQVELSRRAIEINSVKAEVEGTNPNTEYITESVVDKVEPKATISVSSLISDVKKPTIPVTSEVATAQPDDDSTIYG